MSNWPVKKLKLFITVIVLGVYGAFSWAWAEIQTPDVATESGSVEATLH